MKFVAAAAIFHRTIYDCILELGLRAESTVWRSTGHPARIKWRLIWRSTAYSRLPNRGRKYLHCRILAGYFWQPASRPTLTGLWDSPKHAGRKERYRAATVRESVPVWFRLRRVREPVPAAIIPWAD